MNPNRLLAEDREAVAALAKAIEDPAFRRGIGLVFQAYTWRLPADESPNHGWTANCRRQGAKEFIEALTATVTPTKAPERSTFGLEPTDDGSFKLPEPKKK